MRLWQRALVRAWVPVKYSAGFNPHICLSLPLPRSVALGSRKELLLVELEEQCPPEDVFKRLSRELVEGIELLSVQYTDAKIKPAPRWARYKLAFSDQVDRKVLSEQVQDFNASTSWPIERAARGRHPRRTLDMRSGLDQLQVVDDTLEFTVKICPSGTIRLDEVTAMLDINKAQMVDWIERIDVGFEPSL